MMWDLPAFQVAPNFGQFAKAGDWEHAWAFPRQLATDRPLIRSYLQGASEVAFEAFFGEAFFGIRFSAEPAAVERFAEDCTHALQQASDGQAFFSAMSKMLGVTRLAERFAFAEVGAVNAWRTIDPFRIAGPRKAYDEFDLVWADLCRTSLARDHLHRKAIEFAFDAPLHHWFALPVSAAQPPYDLSADLLRQSLGYARSANLVVNADASQAGLRLP